MRWGGGILKSNSKMNECYTASWRFVVAFLGIRCLTLWSLCCQISRSQDTSGATISFSCQSHSCQPAPSAPLSPQLADVYPHPVSQDFSSVPNACWRRRWWLKGKELPASAGGAGHAGGAGWVQSLGQEDPLEKETATHSSILACEIPQTEEPGGLTGHGVAKDTT